MSTERQRPYPGEAATPAELLSLAREYRRSAEALVSAGRRKQPLSWAPYRLVAIHAVELYLNAYLVSAGHTQGFVRSLQHDTASRVALATTAKLKLRAWTSRHLADLAATREYLVTRYDPAPTSTSQLNRLHATLTEVAEKVSAAISPTVGVRGDAALNSRPAR